MFAVLDGASFWWWLIVALLLGAGEMLLFSYVLLWPALAAALVALWLVAAPGASGEAQVTLFGVATLALGGAGYVLRRRRRPADAASRLNRRGARLVGARGAVIAPGQVSVAGDVWPARAADGAPLATGGEVVVMAVEGGALVVAQA